MNGIIEITRGLSIDRHNRKITEVAPASQICLGNPLRLRFRFRHYFGRENVRQMMLSDNDLNVDADVARPAENLNHAARWREAALGVARDFHVHYRAIQLRQPRSSIVRHSAAYFRRVYFLAQIRSQFVARRNRHLVLNSCVIWQHHVSMGTVAKKPDDRRILPL